MYLYHCSLLAQTDSKINNSFFNKSREQHVRQQVLLPGGCVVLLLKKERCIIRTCSLRSMYDVTRYDTYVQAVVWVWVWVRIALVHTGTYRTIPQVLVIEILKFEICQDILTLSPLFRFSTR